MIMARSLGKEQYGSKASWATKLHLSPWEGLSAGTDSCTVDGGATLIMSQTTAGKEVMCENQQPRYHSPDFFSAPHSRTPHQYAGQKTYLQVLDEALATGRASDPVIINGGRQGFVARNSSSQSIVSTLTCTIDLFAAMGSSNRPGTHWLTIPGPSMLQILLDLCFKKRTFQKPSSHHNSCRFDPRHLFQDA